MTDEQALYTGFELHRGEWLAMYCNVKFDQANRQRSENLVWVRNDDVCDIGHRAEIARLEGERDVAVALLRAYQRAVVEVADIDDTHMASAADVRTIAMRRDEARSTLRGSVGESVVVAEGIARDLYVERENGLITFYGIKQNIEGWLVVNNGRQVKVTVQPVERRVGDVANAQRDDGTLLYVRDGEMTIRLVTDQRAPKEDLS